MRTFYKESLVTLAANYAQILRINGEGCPILCEALPVLVGLGKALQGKIAQRFKLPFSIDAPGLFDASSIYREILSAFDRGLRPWLIDSIEGSIVSKDFG